MKQLTHNVIKYLYKSLSNNIFVGSSLALGTTTHPFVDEILNWAIYSRRIRKEWSSTMSGPYIYLTIISRVLGNVRCFSRAKAILKKILSILVHITVILILNTFYIQMKVRLCDTTYCVFENGLQGIIWQYFLTVYIFIFWLSRLSYENTGTVVIR